MEAPERHPKGWGEEQWIANNPQYCGKKLLLDKGKRCSVHYHKLKDETFYVQSGAVQMDTYPFGYPAEPIRRMMRAGESIHIPPGLPHQFTGVEQSEVFEFSTEHREDDTYRLANGDSQLHT